MDLVQTQELGKCLHRDRAKITTFTKTVKNYHLFTLGVQRRGCLIKKEHGRITHLHDIINHGQRKRFKVFQIRQCRRLAICFFLYLIWQSGTIVRRAGMSILDEYKSKAANHGSGDGHPLLLSPWQLCAFSSDLWKICQNGIPTTTSGSKKKV